MRVLILNDTSKYHYGCVEVIKNIKKMFLNYTVIMYKKGQKINYDDYDIFCINGEGSMHHNAPNILKYLTILKSAKSKNKITLLVNSVWQDNSIELTKLLEYVDYISVRENKSKNEIKKVLNRYIDVNLDLSYYTNITPIDSKKYDIIAGNTFIKGKKNVLFKNIGEDGIIDIFNQDWNTIVNILKKSNLLVTGRHHELYAACVAECPFIILEGNTHKNSGLIEMADVKIPILPMDASENMIKSEIKLYQKNIKEYTKLFNFMKNYNKDYLLNFKSLVNLPA